MSKKIFFTALCLFTFTAVGLAQLAMPVSEKVGVEAITPEIEPITAPFDMSKVVKPVFPARTISIAKKGAKQEILSTAAIQKAIDEISRKGGGTVTVPAGKWKTGRITLKSNVNLHIAEGAELHFSGDIRDYLPVVFTRYEGVEVYSLGALIYANGAENIALTGKGKLIGPGKDCEISRNIFSGTQIDRWQNPVAERVFDGANGGKVMPPHFFAPINCRNILVEGVRFEKTVFWQVVPQYCRNVIIRGITTSSSGTQRSDGIDIESSSDVLVEYCTLDCGDDCFTLKAGRSYDGVRVNRPTENVVIRYCRALRGWGGIVIGSETAGGFRNIYAHDCIFDGTKIGIRFKTRRNRGGWTENIFYERIAMKNVGIAFMFDLLGAESSVGDLAKRFPKPEITPLTPAIKDIHVRDFTVENANRFLTVNAIPEIPLSNVLIENGTVSCKIFAPGIYDCDGFTLRNLQIAAENEGGAIEGKNIVFDNVRFSKERH